MFGHKDGKMELALKELEQDIKNIRGGLTLEALTQHGGAQRVAELSRELERVQNRLHSIIGLSGKIHDLLEREL
jgi:hypothetical protein